jgi:hypothetical protein
MPTREEGRLMPIRFAVSAAAAHLLFSTRSSGKYGRTLETAALCYGLVKSPKCLPSRS